MRDIRDASAYEAYALPKVRHATAPPHGLGPRPPPPPPPPPRVSLPASDPVGGCDRRRRPLHTHHRPPPTTHHPPLQLYIKQYYCIEAAVHQRIVRSRSAENRRNREPPARFQRR